MLLIEYELHVQGSECGTVLVNKATTR